MTGFTKQFSRCISAVLATAAISAASVIPGSVLAQPNKSPLQRTVTLGVGQGVNFATGKATTRAAEADMVFRYLPPQPGMGEHYYNAITRRMEFRMTARTDQNLPVLAAAKTGCFKTRPDLSKFTVGDINYWTPNEYDIATGRYLIVRGAVDGKHYLLHITKYAAPSGNPYTWRLHFTYKPIKFAIGGPGTAGKGMALSGTLTYLESVYAKKIIDINVATGNVAERFDGYAPSRDAKGEIAYIDQAYRIVIVGPDGAQRALFPAPETDQPTFMRRGPDDAVISPDGNRIAVQVKRSSMVESGAFRIAGLPHSGIAVVDRTGRELAYFPEKASAAWTPDGRLVVAEYFKPGIYISDREVQHLQRLHNSPEIQQTSGLAVSPDGSRLAFAGNGRVWTMKMDGTDLKQITRSGREESAPTWSPDGRFIAFRAQVPTALAGIYELEIVRIADGKMVGIVDGQGGLRAPDGRIVWR